MSIPRGHRYVCGLCGRFFAAARYGAEDLPPEKRLCPTCGTLPPAPREQGEEDDQDDGEGEAGASA